MSLRLAENTKAYKLLSAARRAKQGLPDPLPGLLVLTDPDRMPDPAALARALPRGTGLIYRHFGATDRELVARDLRRITQSNGCRLLIANDAHLARAVHADGVHWPERQAGQARRWRHAFALMTASAHGAASCARAQSLPVDAILVSTVFASDSPTASAPMGHRRFHGIARRSRLPVFALGGVSADTAGRIATAGGLATIAGARDAFLIGEILEAEG